MEQPYNHLYAFGPFLLDSAQRLLLRDGASVALTPKVLTTLLILVQNQGRVVSKDELMQAVWPGAVVEEGGLTRNISVLRKALGDGSNGNRYIVTVPGQGYSFVAEIQKVRLADEDTSPDANAPVSEKVKPVQSATTSAPARRASHWLRLAALSALVLFVCAAVWLLALRRAPELPSPRTAVFTSFPGNERDPSFSPDGNQIAFSWDGEKGNNLDIYVKQIGNENLLRLTSGPAHDVSPAWSPDGRYIAFTRLSAQENALYLIPSLGGVERKIAEKTAGYLATSLLLFTLSWSPDGEWLAVMDKNSPQEPSAIFLIAPKTGERRQLTFPVAGENGDAQPAFSPDGKMVAFFRGTGGGSEGDIYLVPVAGGEPRRLTFDQVRASAPAWTPDGREVLFLSDRSGGSTSSLWRVPATGGSPVRVEAAGRDITNFAISRQGNRLAWTQTVFDMNIWRLELTGEAKQKASPHRLIASTRMDRDQDLSPDGNKIVFASDRSGSWELWVCRSDGQQPIQLTDFNRSLCGSPRWSPDGRQIVFDSRLEGSADIYVINAEGGKPRRLTTEQSYDCQPSWSLNGEWIYFNSNRSGSPQIWKIPAAGGPAVQITSQGGGNPIESPDGQFLYYMKWPGIWRMPVGGGEEKLVLDHHGAGSTRYWTVMEQGIYFATAMQPEQPLIEYYSFATGQVTPIATLDRKIGLNGTSGLSVSPAGRWLIWQQLDQVSSDIMLLENFR